MAYVVRIDISGTFTDAFAIDESGPVLLAKTPSTTPDFSRGLWCSARACAPRPDPRFAASPSFNVDEEIVFRQWCCPGCFVALHTEVVPAGEPTYRSKEV